MSPSRRLCIGSYTAATEGRGGGLTVVEANPSEGTLRVLSMTAVDSPSFTVRSANGEKVFAVEETAEGAVTEFAVHGDRLERVTTNPSEGGRPCHLAIHPGGKFLAVSNYAGDTFATLALDESGSLQGVVSVIRHEGVGATESRQTQPHPHTVAFSPSGDHAVLVDGGLDNLSVHAVDKLTGTVELEPVSVAHCNPGSGPRHVAWIAPDRLAVVEELSATVSTFRWTNSVLTGPTAVAPSSVSGTDSAWPSELVAIGDSRVAVANRTAECLTLLKIERDAISPARDIPLPPKNARHFAIVDGFAYVALQDADTLACLDLRSGKVVATLALGSPAHVAVWS
jgi:6-phosphogluconolactonase